MAFEPRPRGKQTRFSATNSVRPNKSDFSAEMVSQIAEAVKSRLIAEGIPIQADHQTSKEQVPNASVGEMLGNGAVRIGHIGESPFEPHLLQGQDELASKIDHTLLKPDATPEEVKRLCEEARKYHFATVCVNPTHIRLAAQCLEGSSVKPIAVVGFPLGASSSASKSFEAREAIKNGAREIDMVINVGALKAKDYDAVISDIRAVADASQPYPLKVILETGSLTQNEKIIACALSKAAGAAFVKTSTGFGSGGATAEDIALMREVVGPTMGMKASGGIRSQEDAKRMIEAGASRIGASASVAIVTGKGSSEGPAKKYKSGLY